MSRSSSIKLAGNEPLRSAERMASSAAPSAASSSTPSPTKPSASFGETRCVTRCWTKPLRCAGEKASFVRYSPQSSGTDPLTSKLASPVRT